MYYLYSILWLLLVQTKATSAGAAPANAGDATAVGTVGGPAEAPPSFFEQMIYFLPMMLAMMLVYLFVMKPPAKGGGRSGDTLDLKKNDRVVTVGGIVGTVIKNDTDSETVTLRVDESGSTKMQFLKTAIAKVLSDDKDKEKSSDKK